VRTKQQRLCAVMDAYCELVGGRPVTADEVAEWALVSGLWPVPTVRDSAELGEAWAKRLAAAKASWSKFQKGGN
jgi:hypothetical protein